MDLREWMILYIKHKDIHARKLVRYREEKEKLVFEFKDHHVHAYAMERLVVPPVDGKTMVATLQTGENIEFLIRNWKAFEKLQGLTLVFVNPIRNEKWFIVPYTHSQIADPNIELGIKAMAENVSYV